VAHLNETQQNAKKLNISVSRGSAANIFGVVNNVIHRFVGN